jgi:hypothetical protein
LEPDETKLGEDSIFLSVDQRRKVTDWWLAVKKGANTPNWDIVSTCTIGNQRGLILVEAKAHGGELKPDDRCSASDTDNLNRIAKAIREANSGLNTIIPGWALSTELRYQLCNRFAWSWKIATLGVPVILIYLGFLNAEEMADQGQPFQSASEWTEALLGYARGIVPDGAWNQRLEIDGTQMWPLIRAMNLRCEVLGSPDRCTV